MNRKLIGAFSVFGVLMGIATVLGLTKGIEGLLWLVIAIFCAYWIVRQTETKHFQHGLMVGLIAGSIAPLIQVIFFSTYAANNPEITRDISARDGLGGWSVKTFFWILIPFIAAINGLVLGLLSWAVGKIFKKNPA